MLYTSNELQKKLDKLIDERNKIQSLLSKNSEFTASISEDVEILKLENAFDLENTLNEIESYNSKIMKIKHAKNVFNSTFKLPCGYTIDEAIIRMGILSGLKGKLNDLSMKKAKERKTNGMMREPEYVYATYDISFAKEAYQKLFDELQTIQNELNSVNATEQIEVDVE